jgi:hypothetical protein
MDLEIQFSNDSQRQFVYSTARNQCFSGGFNNGKSFGACLKAVILLTTFPKYRMFIARQTFKDLKVTTMETFFKIMPKEYVARHNEQDGFTELINGSTILWLHLDKVDESTLRGLEVNSGLVDQAEEIEEKVADVLDARIGRWDNAEIPLHLLEAYKEEHGEEWPKNQLTGKYLAPSYLMYLVNPDTQFHFIYRYYHPDSLERRPDYFFVEAEWDPNLGSAESFENALKHDEEWVDKYVKGKWGISQAQIHRVRNTSYLEYDPDFLKTLRRKGNLYRVMDHGETSPTCCLWFAVYQGVFICYREYYVPNRVISEHRAGINDLSEFIDERGFTQVEHYSADYADPSIFDKESKKRAGFWSVADEYITNDIPGKPIVWLPADNNEFATRNRINELLKPSERFKHPITGETPAPGLYFVKKSIEYPNGAFQCVNQLGSQRRVLVGYENGKAIYADDRDEKVTDHAYDPIRYFVAMHGSPLSPKSRVPPKRSIQSHLNIVRRRKMLRPTSIG